MSVETTVAGRSLSTARERPVARGGACLVLLATGVGVALPGGRALLSGAGGAPLVLAALCVVLGGALAATAVGLYLVDLTTARVARVVGWNVLGVVVLGAVLAAAAAHPAAALPDTVAAAILGVSAVAHVIIGVTDVARIRADELATKRRNLAVLNRLVRHDLRNEAQALSGATARLDAGQHERARERVERTVDRLGAAAARVGEFRSAIEEPYGGGTVALAPVVREAAASVTDRHPDLDATVSIADACSVAGDDHLETAFERLFESLGEGASAFEAESRTGGEWATVTVTHDGDPVPAAARAVLTGERPITQLEHAEGLGLWVVQAVLERYGGELAFEDDGRTVLVRLPAA